MALSFPMVVFTWIALSCLLFIRNSSGGLTFNGFMLFLFFGSGAASCLYMLVFEIDLSS